VSKNVVIGVNEGLKVSVLEESNVTSH